MVQLRLRSNVHRQVVTIADVAELSGGNAELREQIGALDLDQIETDGDELGVNKLQVQIRIRLSQIPADSFRVLGPETCQVTLNLAAITDEIVTQAIREQLAAQWRVQPDEVSVTLTRALPKNTLPADYIVSEDHALHVEPIIATHAVPGRLSITMGVYEDKRLLMTFPASIEARIIRSVAIAKRFVGAGERLTVDDVTFERKELSGAIAVRMATYEDLDRYTNCTIRAGQPVDRNALTDVDPQLRRTDADQTATRDTSAKSPANDPDRVAAKSPVLLVFRAKQLTLTCENAELVSAGVIGEMVVARNLDTKLTVRGRLVSRNTVEVR
ncbi:MAG: hypothetical protein KDB23_08180 [Planctomycetales bacterium]|nr:hypothetical protein [Planctomycetales bacterium]